MKRWGLTGGIASGKSTTSKLFRELGAHVADADAMYHQLLLPQGGAASPVALSIGAAFPGVLGADGIVDRTALGARVFADPRARAQLNALTHPAVAQAVLEQMAAWEQAGVGHVLYDVPLLYENGLQAGLDGVVVVWIPEAVQVARLMARDGLTQAAAVARLGAQMPLEEKRRRATWVVDNSGSVAATAVRVGEIWGEMRGLGEATGSPSTGSG